MDGTRSAAKSAGPGWPAPRKAGRAAPKRRAGAGARPRRNAPRHTGRVVAISLAFAALIGAGLYAANGPLGLAAFKPFAASGFFRGAPAAPADTVTLDPADPVARFEATGVGHMLFPEAGTDGCRRVLFDNRSGAYYQADDIACGRKATPQRAEPGPADRLNAMRDTFRSGR